MLNRNLQFTRKSREDFNFIMPENSSNGIIDLAREIDFYDVSHRIQKYYIDLTEQIRRKIKSFSENIFADDLSLSAAKRSLMELNNAYNNISDWIDEMKNSTDAEDISMKIINILTSLDINVQQQSAKQIIKQGRDLNTGRDVELYGRLWEEAFKRALTNLDESRKMIESEIREEAEKLNFRIVSNLYEIAEAIQDHYNTEIRKLSDIQQLPSKLAKECDVMTKMIGEIGKATTASELVKTIHDCANMLDIIVPKEHMLDITNQGRYLEFLKNASKGELVIKSSSWIKPFETVVKNLHQSQKWYTFLNALYNKFSEYEIQMDRRSYNVANLEDWGETDKPQGIKITSTTYNEFLNKITKFNITEQDNVRNITLTGQQLEELNHILKLTLDHILNIKCEKPSMTFTASYFNFAEAAQTVINSIDKYEGCAQLNILNFTSYNVFALNTIFIDNDIPMSILKTQFFSMMAPKWEVVKKSRIDISGAKGLSHVGPFTLFWPRERLKAANGTSPGAKGADGRPGGPGEPGGNILAIGDTFVNGKDLILSVNGGEGGTAEHGGDGYSGKPNQLGNGGNGGRGGKGGLPGTITLFELSGDSGIVKETNRGKQGEDGDGGKGGSAGWNGPYGKRGIDGGNTVGLLDPKPPKILKDPAKVVNKYKTYLLENMVDPFTRTHYIQFLEKIDSNDTINSLYDTTGFIEEFERLEKQFPQLSKNVDFVPFYKSLLPRISEYSKSPKGDEKSSQYKKVLNFLYTATLGRIFNLEDDSDSNLIINIGGYLDIVKREIKTLRDLQKEHNKAEIISKYQERYKDNLDRKIEEAKNIIEKMITPEMGNISKDMDGKIDLLVDETIELKKKAEKEKEALIKKKQELERAMAVRGIFSCLSIFGQVLSFFGPVGAVVGTVIGATSSVAESLVLDNQQQDVQMPSDVVPKLKILGDQIKSVREKKVKYLSKLLEEITQEIGKNPKKLGDMSEKIADLKSRLNKAKENAYDFKKIKALESELKQELKNKEGQLKIKTPDEKTKGALKAVEKLSQAAQLGSLLVDVYNKHKSDQGKIDAITDAIDQTDGQIQKLKEYEEQIYEVISPTLHNMESNLQDVASKLDSQVSGISDPLTKKEVPKCFERHEVTDASPMTEGFQRQG
ncbi:hypothetical protein HNY73_007704 [Argiope bruennichi]|uniref:Uncharacterized protein n=1 Tax=Argiope bruennichi TaxID=94029 RepID=A0A8T0FFP7_ARGBR|nr:hypothetical protein HNY73_007704 [Argiope bruennichi]